MNNIKLKPIDIINAAIAEIYGKQTVDLIKFFTKLHDSGKSDLIEYVKWLSESDKYKKVAMIRIAETGIKK